MKFTNDELRATFDQMKPHRPGWPSTFDEAQRLPLVHAILESMTARPGALRWWLEKHERVTSPVKLDWRRRASGEKESDFD